MLSKFRCLVALCAACLSLGCGEAAVAVGHVLMAPPLLLVGAINSKASPPLTRLTVSEAIKMLVSNSYDVRRKGLWEIKKILMDEREFHPRTTLLQPLLRAEDAPQLVEALRLADGNDRVRVLYVLWLLGSNGRGVLPELVKLRAGMGSEEEYVRSKVAEYIRRNRFSEGTAVATTQWAAEFRRYRQAIKRVITNMEFGAPSDSFADPFHHSVP